MTTKELCLTAALTFTLLTAGEAAAHEYHPASLTACQANVRSTADNGGCFETEIKRLAGRLPTGSAAWLSKTNNTCEAKYAQDGTGGAGETDDCILQAMASKVGAR